MVSAQPSPSPGLAPAPGLKHSTVRSVAAASHFLYHRLGNNPRVFGARSLPSWGRLHRRGAPAAAGGSTPAQCRTACDSPEPPPPARLTNAVVSPSIKKRPALAPDQGPPPRRTSRGQASTSSFGAYGLSRTASPKPGRAQAPPARCGRQRCNCGHLCPGLWAQSSVRKHSREHAHLGRRDCHLP